MAVEFGVKFWRSILADDFGASFLFWWSVWVFNFDSILALYFGIQFWRSILAVSFVARFWRPILAFHFGIPFWP